jgi:hypothetical protein
VSRFYDAYFRPARPIDTASPELRLLEGLAAGDGELAASAVEQHPQWGEGLARVDTPFGIFAGKGAVKILADGFAANFGATALHVTPVVQTRTGGRSVSEVVLEGPGADGPVAVPVTIVGDLHPAGTLEGARLYFFYRWATGLYPYRAPIYRPRHASSAEFPLLTGVVRRYYQLLNLGDPQTATSGILETLAPEFRYGGYRPDDSEPLIDTLEQLRPVYTAICTAIPAEQIIRFETITDDGITCAVEWTSVITKLGCAKGIASQAGFAAYERSSDGHLRSIRINDNLGPR